MGIFVKITAESQGGLTPASAAKNQRELSYIIDALNDSDWQEGIGSRLTSLDPRFSHIALGTILRLFRRENIEARISRRSHGTSRRPRSCSSTR